jgi:hypothetical protein
MTNKTDAIVSECPQTDFARVANPKHPVPPPLLFARIIDQPNHAEIWGCAPGAAKAASSRLKRGIVLLCYRTRDGMRIFLPEWAPDGSIPHRWDSKREGWEAFLQTAAGIGIALREDAKGTPTEGSWADAHRHAVMVQLGEYARRTKGYLSRHFGTKKDLVLDRRGVNSVLSMGFGADGALAGWSVDRLLDEGRSRLSASSGGSPTLSEVIAQGMYAGACAAPWPLPKEATRSRIIRRCLFAETDGAPDGAVEAAYHHLVRLHRRRGATHEAEPLPGYRKWHSGKGTNARSSSQRR